MKRVLASVLIAMLLLSGCTPGKQVYEAVFTDVFDTVATLRGYERSQADFDARAAQVHRTLLEYHRLFDIYEDCPGGLNIPHSDAFVKGFLKFLQIFSKKSVIHETGVLLRSA